jgi:hypothetical protein
MALKSQAGHSSNTADISCKSNSPRIKPFDAPAEDADGPLSSIRSNPGVGKDRSAGEMNRSPATAPLGWLKQDDLPSAAARSIRAEEQAEASRRRTADRPKNWPGLLSNPLTQHRPRD